MRPSALSRKCCMWTCHKRTSSWWAWWMEMWPNIVQKENPSQILLPPIPLTQAAEFTGWRLVGKGRRWWWWRGRACSRWLCMLPTGVRWGRSPPTSKGNSLSPTSQPLRTASSLLFQASPSAKCTCSPIASPKHSTLSMSITPFPPPPSAPMEISSSWGWSLVRKACSINTRAAARDTPEKRTSNLAHTMKQWAWVATYWCKAMKMGRWRLASTPGCIARPAPQLDPSQ